MTLFVDQMPTDNDIERLRLLLSTFQDGTGMLEGGHAPGWRDFERAAAVWLGGSAPESKHIYDVHVPASTGQYVHGYSCKMRGTLKETRKKGDATIEVTNSAKKLWDGLKKIGVTQDNLTSHNPRQVGSNLIATVESWHNEVHIDSGGQFVKESSPMLHLAYDPKGGEYQLFSFSKHLPTQAEIDGFTWSVTGNRLLGLRPDGNRGIEWYFGSGGQLKYYPRITEAFWNSKPFFLEPIGMELEVDFLIAKALTYFPEKWGEVTAASTPE
jgi:hypothetical protein